jgi:protocatechuate 3,4-dioxygenase alpha subunit
MTNSRPKGLSPDRSGGAGLHAGPIDRGDSPRSSPRTPLGTDQRASTLTPTPSQTIGPFFSHALPWPDGPDVVEAGHPGAIRIEGRVYDGNGDAVPDALVETWQADPEGRYPHPDDPSGGPATPFRGFGRCPTDSDGRFAFVTVKPGPVPGPGGSLQAPHIAISVFARGLLNRLVTRVYFPDEVERNAADPVLSSIEDPARRATLVAAAGGVGTLRFDIHLQGQHETVFFDI